MPELLETIGPRAGNSPVTVVLSELGTVDIESAFAHYDGAAASGSFLPAFTVRSQDGSILARVFPSTTVAAGDTADVSFVPLGEAASGSAPAGSGIQFDTDPQTGGWLLVTTTTSPASGFGIQLDASDGVWAHSAGNSTYESDSGVTVRSSAGNVGLVATAGGHHIDLTADAAVNVTANNVLIQLASGVGSLTVNDHLGHPIFKVTDAGALHGKTGQALVFDL